MKGELYTVHAAINGFAFFYEENVSEADAEGFIKVLPQKDGCITWKFRSGTMVVAPANMIVRWAKKQ
jgi:hypothetical protein